MKRILFDQSVPFVVILCNGRQYVGKMTVSMYVILRSAATKNPVLGRPRNLFCTERGHKKYPPESVAQAGIVFLGRLGVDKLDVMWYA
jgi:hypothetical protein